MAREITIADAGGRNLLCLRQNEDVSHISETTLCRHFGLMPGSVVLLQSLKEEGGSLSIQVSKTLRDGAAFFVLDVTYGDQFVIEGKIVTVEEVRGDPLDLDKCVGDIITVEMESKLPCVNSPATPLSASCSNVEKHTMHQFEKSLSVVNLLNSLPAKTKLYQIFTQVKERHQVLEIPPVYDGDCLFELPCSDDKHLMSGMESKFDGHVWTEYVTSNIASFPGIVRRSQCGGHLICQNLQCPYNVKFGQQNQRQWSGRLSKVPPIGMLGRECGSLICMHCCNRPHCIAQCFCCVYYCLPRIDTMKYTRCVIHLGQHEHPVEQGEVRKAISNIKEMVKEKIHHDVGGGSRYIQQQITKDIVMKYLIASDGNDKSHMSETDMITILDQLQPLSNKRRLYRWIEEERAIERPIGDSLNSVLDLKRHCKYEYIHGVIFPGQLDNVSISRCHVFKMSTVGPGSGVDIVNRMRPGGDLQYFWVCFDHVKRVKDWTTMAAHVYDPYVQELETIAICDFKVEDTEAQVLFWTMINQTMEKKGYPPAKFRGFMADEAQANWRAVRTVFNGGPLNVMEGKERSCLFHWEQSMLQHTKNCIKNQFQEMHKSLCRRWRTAPNRASADSELKHLMSWWSTGRVIDGELPKLQTWIMWWHARISHWSQFMVQGMEGAYGLPRTNLSESIHGSWLAAEGRREQMTLYSATVSDMTSAILQTSRCHAYFHGSHHGSGPSLQKLQTRCMDVDKGVELRTRHVNRIVHESVIDMGIATTHDGLQGDSRTVRRTKSLSRKDVIGDNDSHRPEYEYQTRPAKVARHSKRTLQFSTDPKVSLSGALEPRTEVLVVQECDVHETTWAIRRTPARSRAKCSGFLGSPVERCTRLINSIASKSGEGVLAPGFLARRQTPVGTKQQMSWFCGNDVTHTWKLNPSIVGAPGPAPGVWKIAVGSNVCEREKVQLMRAGFVLEGDGDHELPRKSVGSPSHQSRGAESATIDITKSMRDRIDRALNMDARILYKKVIKDNLVVQFGMETSGSSMHNQEYVVQISERPNCNCEDFKRMKSSKEPYRACKHLYYIFFKELGITMDTHPFVHRSQLLPIELFRALGKHTMSTLPITIGDE